MIFSLYLWIYGEEIITYPHLSRILTHKMSNPPRLLFSSKSARHLPRSNLTRSFSSAFFSILDI